jgi:hypothetical protein
MSADHVEHGSAAKRREHHVGVSVSTTAGFYPSEGFNEVPAEQKVEVDLHKAKEHLKIKDTNGWIATVSTPSGKREINTTQSYKENGLSGEVEIDWGPKEGGGG